MTRLNPMNPESFRKWEAHEKRWRERSWKYFGGNLRSRISWARWFRDIVERKQQ